MDQKELLKLIERAELEGMTKLDLSEKELTSLPPEIGNLTQLRELYLFSNELTSLPSEIGNLAQLKELYLFLNKLTSLPPQIGNLAKLTKLRLSCNWLTSLPPEIGNLTQLTELDLSGNQLTSLPSEIGNLSQLTKLGLSDNWLTTLPSEIGNLAKLTKLSLSDNWLTTLPPEIGNLTQMTELDLSHGKLTSLPPEIGNLAQLTDLSLRGNRLTSLPPEIRQLTKLGRLFLHDNPDLRIPPEILGPVMNRVYHYLEPPASPRAILDYYFETVGIKGQELNECKLIVVGRGGAGKTSLVKRLNGEKFDPKEPETHGITIRKLEFDCAKAPVTGRVWDFGGQVVLHSMHEFFLTARTLYLLVLGERDDMLERDAAYWLQLVRSYAGDAPVVVALNKSAGRTRVFDRETLEKKYGPILAWVPTECSETDAKRAGIEDLRRALTEALQGPDMDSVRDKFPRKWFAVKDALETMDESYLDYEEYEKLCDSHNIRDPEEQANLAERLHQLGVAMNYGHDARLRDTSVLRPDWLANGIYAVLRANDTDKNLPEDLAKPLAPDGVITSDLMERIHRKAAGWKMLRPEDYPSEKRSFLLRLMGMFRLSYPLDDDDKAFLVPTLLPLHPPKGGEEEPQSVEKETRARLRYEFEAVPSPLLPSFIAQTFSLIPDRLHWRRGTMLVFGEARGRVWTTPEERHVFATVAGPSHDRMRLIAIIRGTLHELFSNYKGLRPVEQWEHKEQWVPREALEEFGVLPRTQRHRSRRPPDDESPEFPGEVRS